ncbi:MAG: DedA family protein [Bacteriovoracia bacterium]
MQFFHELSGYLHYFVDVVLHLDLHLNAWITQFGPWIYAFMFLVIFCETGLVITPFLPGDSLLFALGALTAVDNAFLKLPLLCFTLVSAAILGDITNYSIGRFFGTKAFSNPNSKLFRREYLDRTNRFYERHGGRALVIARFAPILRTFAPFVAGVAQMTYARFLTFSVIGGFTWVLSITIAGAFFGNLPAVKRNFHVVVVAIIFISLIPVLLEMWKARKEKRIPA